MRTSPQNRHCLTPKERVRTDSAAGLTKAVTPIRVLLVEDDQGIAQAIVEDFVRNDVAVTLARTLAEARAILRKSFEVVDVVILELRLPDGRGESLLPDIEMLSRQPAVIVSSAFLPELRSDALEYRPVAIPKPVRTDELLRIVRTVAPGYTRPIIWRFAKRFDLSRRQRETVALLAQGNCAKQIAKCMCCSEKTVYAHLARICDKTGCHDYHALVGRLFAFACQTMGHTPPDHAAFVDKL
jgi:DNA-binding NarL/FixJ family response regulator